MINNIKTLSAKNDNRILKRGDIYYADLNGLEQAVGSEQTGKRPVLIIQNDVGNIYSPTTIVAILTTKKKRKMPTHVMISEIGSLSKTSTVCLEQIKTIDKMRLDNYCGNIGDVLMKRIDRAICISLGTKRDTEYEELVVGAENEVIEMDLVRRDTAFDEVKRDWVQLAREQMTFFADIKQYMMNLEISVKNMDDEIEDILDYIESTNFNVAQGYKVYRMLRERRKQRKDVINELNQLQVLTEKFECEQMRQVYQSAVYKMEQMQTERCRGTVMQELFEREVS